MKTNNKKPVGVIAETKRQFKQHTQMNGRWGEEYYWIKSCECCAGREFERITYHPLARRMKHFGEIYDVAETRVR